MYTRLHCPDGNRQHLCHLGFAQPLEVAQHDHSALLGIHGSQGGDNVQRIVGSAELIAWSVGVSKRPIRQFGVGGIGWNGPFGSLRNPH